MKRIFNLFLLCVLALTAVSCQPNRLRIMSYNIRIGIGMDNKTDLQRAADVINRVKPDFVGLQEVDSIAERSYWVDQAKALGEMTGMHYIFAPALERSKGLYGIAALVKEKPISYRNIGLPGKEELRTFLVLEYEDYLLCNTHFSLVAESRKESVEIIRRVIAEYNKPAIITGDFNMYPTSEEYHKMDEMWMPLSDTTRFTFPADGASCTIDYIWGREGYKYKVLNYEVIDEPMASDHLPLYIDVEF
ncbi:MAG: endonuclease/exonuclease/phosphatase family protein [Alistipes sp.]|nr:endonuclease/exonuclease/phosphatase family protein [Alistipes sp.]